VVDVVVAKALLLEKLAELSVFFGDPSGSHLHFCRGLDALELAYP
jgi:hypothetical protein